MALSRGEWDVRELLLQGFVRSTFAKMELPEGCFVEFDRVSDRYTDGMWLGVVFVDSHPDYKFQSHIARVKLMPGTGSEEVVKLCRQANQALSRSIIMLSLAAKAE